MKLLKKFTAVVTAVAMLSVGNIGILQPCIVSGVDASGNMEINATATDQIDVSGTNSLGDLISEEINGAADETAEALANDTYGIYDLNMQGNNANVVCYGKTGATLFVGIYDEKGLQLLASGTHKIVTTDDEVENIEATVAIKGEIPEYFLVKAFMLDKKQIPLCEVYVCENYTESITKVRESVITDYDPELVVNLDEKEDTNFLVLEEKTKKIEYNGTSNILESADDEKLIYVFKNADETITSLGAGDIFYYDYNNSETILTIKVASIEKDGSDVTIIGDPDVELTDVFYAIKIEETIDGSNGEFEPDYEENTDLGYGFTYMGKTTDNNKLEPKSLNFPNNKKANASGTVSKEFAHEWTWKVADGKFAEIDTSIIEGEFSGTVSLNFKLKLTMQATIYLFDSSSVADIKVMPEIGISGTASLSARLVVKFIDLDANFLDLLAVGGYVGVEFSGEVKAVFECTVSMTIAINVGDGSKKLITVTPPELKGTFKAEAEFFFGVVSAYNTKIFSTETEGSAKFGIKATAVLFTSEEKKTDEYIHECSKCATGDVSVTYTIKFEKSRKRKIVKSSTESTNIKLFDFYWSMDNDAFGKGDCPRRAYKTTFSVLSSTGKPIEGAMITGFRDYHGASSAITDENGKATVYLKRGTYMITTSAMRFEKEISSTQTITVKDEYITPSFKLCPEKIPVIITIIDENGNIVKGVKVSSKTESIVLGMEDIYVSEGITDENGKVVFDITTLSSMGTYVTVTDSASNLSVEDELNFTEDERDFVFLLKENGGFVKESITVIVVDENDNRIANATVEIGEVDYSILDKGDEFYSCGSFSTDSNGKAEIRFPMNSYVDSFRVSADGFPEITDDFVLVEGTQNYVFRLSETNGGFVGNSSDDNDNNDENNNKPPTEIIASGECGADGENLTWALDNEGTLTISGEGDMYYYYSTAPWYSNRANITDIVMEDGITSIENHAFEDCNRLTSIIIPDSVTSIGSSAFSGCESLTSITISDSVTSIGNYAFYYCNSLTSITIPDSVTSIGSHAFEGCNRLTSIIIPDSVTSIGEYAFKYCTSIISVTIPDSVTSIGSSAFSGCESLTSITISDSVTSIGNYAFYDCDRLTSIAIPDSVTILGEGLFADCGNLKYIIVSNNIISADGFLDDCSASIYGVGGSLLHEKYKDQFYAIIPSPNVEILYSGTFGEDGNNLKWELDSDGRLTISGEGAMPRYSDLSDLPPWNSYKSMVKIAVIEEGVTNIGAAFWEHSSLKLVSIPSSVEEIQYAAFSECMVLENTFTCVEDIYDLQLNGIVIPEGVKTIEEDAFYNCSEIEKISIPSTLNRLDKAFKNTAWSYYNSDGLVYLDNWVYQYNENTNEKEVEIKQGTVGIASGAFEGSDNLTSITIPDGVISIGEKAFYECHDLTSITIPESVTNIGSNAFASTAWIQAKCEENPFAIVNGILIDVVNFFDNVVIPDNVTKIGENAFSFCHSLISVKIPDSVTSIEDGAFWYCEDLTSVAIPSSVTSIGGIAFACCDSLTDVYYSGTEEEWSNILIESGNDRLYDSDVTIHFNCEGPEKEIIDSGTCGAEGDNLIWTLDNEGTLTISGDGKMDDWISWYDNKDDIVSVFIGNGVTSIEDDTFDDCDSLISINVDIDNKYYVSEEGVLFNKDKTKLIKYPQRKYEKIYTIPDGVASIGDNAFYYCDRLTSITLPDSVINIEDNAFYYCDRLTSITIPNSVTSIGKGAFEYCDSLTSIIIPDSVINIGDNAFYYCNSLTSITIPDSVTSIGKGAFACCSSLTSITLPDSVTSIGDGAFENCHSLTSITLPDSVTSIGSSAFGGCESLTSITISDSVTSIGKGAFACCSSLTSITIPDSVTIIEDGTFYGCESLTSIIIPDSVTSIGEDFDSTPWLEEKRKENPLVIINGILIDGQTCDGNVVIPDSVTIIRDEAFENCKSLTSIAIPDSVTSIGNRAFYDCEILTSITIPNSVTSIGDDVFANCEALTYITIPDSVTSIGYDVFDNTPWLDEKRKENPLVIVNGILIDGQTCDGNVIIPDSVTIIGDEAFENCKSLTSITIPDSVTSIGDRAFYECAYLTSITIPDSVTSIGNSSFSWCYNLKYITIPDSVTNIGNYAFEDCKSLTSITIPNNVAIIGDHAFDGCNLLSSISISGSVTSIGDYAFVDCNSLTSVTIPASVTNIGDYAFDDCDSLYSITIENCKCEFGDIWPNFPQATTIYGYTGSTAHTYAEMYGNEFVSLGEEPLITIPTTTSTTSTTTSTTTTTITSKKATTTITITMPNETLNIVTSGEWDASNGNLTRTLDNEGTFIISSEEELIRMKSDSYFPRENYDCTEAIIKKGVTSIGNSAVADCVNLTDVCCSGTKEEGNAVIIDDSNEDLTNATIHYNSTTSATKSLLCVSYSNSSSPSNTKSYTYPNAVPNSDYLLLAINSAEVEDILSSDNLLYIDQQTADESGSVTFSYAVLDDCTYIFIGDFGKGEYCRIVSNPISTDTEKCTICTYVLDEDENGETSSDTITTTTTTTVPSTTTTTATSTTTSITTTTSTTTTTTTLTTTTSTSTTTATTAAHIASDEEFCDWAVKDYAEKTGITPENAEIEYTSDGTAVITLTDAEGNVLDVYSIDPFTGVGNGSDGGEVNLPQTGFSPVYNYIMLTAAAMVLFGIIAMVKSRRRDEE